MWGVVTRDYSKYMTPKQVLENVKDILAMDQLLCSRLTKAGLI